MPPTTTSPSASAATNLRHNLRRPGLQLEHRLRLRRSPAIRPCTAAAGRLTIDGGGGDDIIVGGPNLDTIDGGDGDDRLTGGPNGPTGHRADRRRRRQRRDDLEQRRRRRPQRRRRRRRRDRSSTTAPPTTSWRWPRSAAARTISTASTPAFDIDMRRRPRSLDHQRVLGQRHARQRARRARSPMNDRRRPRQRHHHHR